MFYSRPQLRLLLILGATLLVGFAVREWRAGFPDAADRLERFDRDETVTPPLSLAGPERAPRPPAPSAPVSSAAPGKDSRRDPPGLVNTPPVPDPRPLDLNRANAAELARLPGVGPGLAQRIVEERDRRGRFDSPEALRHVLGLGPKKLAAIRSLVTVSE